MEKFQDLNDQFFIAYLNHNNVWARWSGPWEASGPKVLELVKKIYPERKFALIDGARLWSEITEEELNKR